MRLSSITLTISPLALLRFFRGEEEDSETDLSTILTFSLFQNLPPVVDMVCVFTSICTKSLYSYY